MSDYRSCLGRFANSMRDPMPENAKRAARQAFKESGGKIILINTDWLSGWADQEQARQLAKKAHRGQR